MRDGLQLHRLAYWPLIPLLRPEVLPAPHPLPPATRRRWLGAAARSASLFAGTLALGAWRLQRNGGTAPRFNAYENPAALHPHPLFRALSIGWVRAAFFAARMVVGNCRRLLLPRGRRRRQSTHMAAAFATRQVWAEYVWVAFVPTALACDWSYPALPPISQLSDPRVPVLAAFVCAAGMLVFWAALLPTARRRVLLCMAAFALPFLLASNLVTVVGTAKVSRQARASCIACHDGCC